MRRFFGVIIGVVIGFILSQIVIEFENHGDSRIKQAIAPKQFRMPITNFVSNGLEAWAADTNHPSGQEYASRIKVCHLPSGKFAIRFVMENGSLSPFFEKDTIYDSEKEARWALGINIPLRVKKAFADAMEDTFRTK